MDGQTGKSSYSVGAHGSGECSRVYPYVENHIYPIRKERRTDKLNHRVASLLNRNWNITVQCNRNLKIHLATILKEKSTWIHFYTCFILISNYQHHVLLQQHKMILSLVSLLSQSMLSYSFEFSRICKPIRLLLYADVIAHQKTHFNIFANRYFESFSNWFQT